MRWVVLVMFVVGFVVGLGLGPGALKVSDGWQADGPSTSAPADTTPAAAAAGRAAPRAL